MTEENALATNALSKLSRQLKAFAEARDWEQFHSPKNLSMALIAEAAELVEHFQWLSEEQSRQLSEDKLEAVSLELADIFIYTLRCAEVLGVDLLDATRRKIAINDQRYPADRVRGDARRAGEYED